MEAPPLPADEPASSHNDRDGSAPPSASAGASNQGPPAEPDTAQKVTRISAAAKTALHKYFMENNYKRNDNEEDLRELYWVRAGDLYLSSSVDGLARRKGGRDHFLKRLGGHWGLHSLHQLLGTEIYQATEQDCQQD
eukprot:CAMPEP_0172531602 /NCGR_PEP_ID=MMETSP1067-20121228/4942_1 /TAXON_ID=265564 ORGANISM="Thalassiosira punctigera, Strain Tpunct2005C2" /NCGR_SAMPLE_ID=MMETSP1067 /ASSEMBLY_ACC=CAM_ASM_000444 /LENGTH=136 /DNA_ID=CAMNT_0013315999 /DNA_START=259 /DNA_END=670 /DNA_ORIENTATION=-